MEVIYGYIGIMETQMGTTVVLGVPGYGVHLAAVHGVSYASSPLLCSFVPKTVHATVLLAWATSFQDNL